jgi:hypothetical protein
MRKCLWFSPILIFFVVGQTVHAFDNSSFAGCYVTSLYGNILGPEINVDPTTSQPAPNFAKRVLHGTAIVGRLCSDGAGNVTEVSATLNVAGLCSALNTGTGTYSVAADGTGAASATVTIPSDAVLPDSCALLGIQAGDQSTFGFSFVLDGQSCAKVIGLSVVTPMGPIPLVTEGEACPQVAPQ